MGDCVPTGRTMSTEYGRKLREGGTGGREGGRERRCSSMEDCVPTRRTMSTEYGRKLRERGRE